MCLLSLSGTAQYIYTVCGDLQKRERETDRGALGDDRIQQTTKVKAKAEEEEEKDRKEIKTSSSLIQDVIAFVATATLSLFSYLSFRRFPSFSRQKLRDLFIYCQR